MFELVDRPQVWIPVEWPGLAPGPSPDDIAVETTHRVELLCELIDRDAVQKLFLDPEDNTPEAEIFGRIVHNWRKVSARGVAVPFNPENAALLLKAPGFAIAFTTAYLNAVAGKTETREKNSQGSPNNGRADEASEPAKPTPTSGGNASASG